MPSSPAMFLGACWPVLLARLHARCLIYKEALEIKDGKMKSKSCQAITNEVDFFQAAATDLQGGHWKLLKAF